MVFYLNRDFRVLFSSKGFSILEVLIAIVIFSVALVAMSSISLTLIGGNNSSRHFTEASILAQDTLESIRNVQPGFDLGADMTLDPVSSCNPTIDDTIPSLMANCNTSNDAVTDEASLFASPDHAYDVDAYGNETSILLNGPSLTTANTLRRSWTIRDNTPAAGMKTVTVVVGWSVGSSSRYMAVSSAFQGN
ncbi:MAG: hypothetical protein IEMM0002_1295 [bacterium]|nr:MAG: hypothetical protein IEMM0002_1295 [bacterium]